MSGLRTSRDPPSAKQSPVETQSERRSLRFWQKPDLAQYSAVSIFPGDAIAALRQAGEHTLLAGQMGRADGHEGAAVAQQGQTACRHDTVALVDEARIQARGRGGLGPAGGGGGLRRKGEGRVGK